MAWELHFVTLRGNFAVAKDGSQLAHVPWPTLHFQLPLYAGSVAVVMAVVTVPTLLGLDPGRRVPTPVPGDDPANANRPPAPSSWRRCGRTSWGTGNGGVDERATTPIIGLSTPANAAAANIAAVAEAAAALYPRVSQRFAGTASFDGIHLHCIMHACMHAERGSILNSRIRNFEVCGYEPRQCMAVSFHLGMHVPYPQQPREQILRRC